MFYRFLLSLIFIASFSLANSEISYAAAAQSSQPIAEFGKATLTDNIYTTINLSNSYTNPIVVASARYSTAVDVHRDVRIRNKLASSFEIKVDNVAGSLSGTTDVDWLVFEAGTYSINNGVDSTKVIAGSINVPQVACRGNFTTAGTTVNFSPAFDGAPAVLHNVSSDIDTSWVTSSVHDGVNRANEATASLMVLTLQRSFESCTHGAEDIDYIAFDAEHGTNGLVEFESLVSADNVSCCGSTGVGVNFNTSFAGIPQTIIVAQNGEDGGDGGYALVHTGAATSNSAFRASIDEGTLGSRTHTTERISALSFLPASGELLGSGNAPGDIFTNLELWLKADSFNLSDNDPIDTWEDSSDNGHEVSQSALLRPLFKNNDTDNLNFNPIVEFDGIDDFLEDTDGQNYLNGQNSATAVFVIRSNSATSDVGFFRTDTGTGDNGFSIRYDASGLDGGGVNGLKFGDGSSPENTGETSSNSQTTNPQLLTLTRTTGTVPEFFIDGRADTLTNVPGNSLAISGLDFLRIGDHGKGVWDGDIAEAIIYTQDLNPSDRNQVESYLAIKYGLTLDQGEPGGKDYINSDAVVVWDASANGIYNNNIAAIARDDGSALDQSKSKSSLPGALVTIESLGSLDDDDFLVWAHDNGSTLSFTTSEAPVGVERIAREWKVNELINDTGTVKVSIDVADLPATTSTVVLITDPDGDFSDASSFVAMTEVSGTYEATINLSNNEFFTFGINNLVVPSYQVAEFGTVNVSNTTAVTVNLSKNYKNLVVVASTRYNTNQTQRSARVVNKTLDSFEIKMHSDNNNATGNTTIDWLAMEGGSHLINNGTSLTKVIAGTVNTSVISCNGNFPLGTLVNFDPAFDAAPMVLHTVSSNNDTNWVVSSVNNGSQASTPTNTSMRVTLQDVFSGCTHGSAEDIDYIAIDEVHGTNNSNEFETIITGTNVSCCSTTGNSNSFNTSFSSVPQVTLVSQHSDNGANGGFALVHTGSNTTTSNFFTSIDEDGPGADRGHTNESVSFMAFSSSAGTLNAVPAPGGVVTDLELWLRADAGVLDTASSVDSWNSQDPNSFSFTPPGVQPTINSSALNFNDSISFNNGGLIDTVGILTNDYSIFSVASTNNDLQAAVIYQDSGNFTAASGFNALSSPNILSAFNTGGGAGLQDSLEFDQVVNGDFYISNNSVSGTDSTLLVNGTNANVTSVVNTKGTNPSLITATMGIGTHSNTTSARLNGDIAEVAIYNDDIDLAKQAKIHSYLGIKYGLSLDQSLGGQNYVDSGGNTIWDAAANIGFRNDIAGIGVDDASSLNQRKSRSENSDARVTIEEHPTLGDLENCDFVFWSNDNDDDGTVEAIETGLPDGFSFIFDRNWRISQSEDPGTVRVSIDVSGTGKSCTLETLKLLVDTDIDYTSGTTIIDATSFDGTTAIFDAVNFSDGNFFTIGIDNDEDEQLFFGMPY